MSPASVDAETAAPTDNFSSVQGEAEAPPPAASSAAASGAPPEKRAYPPPVETPTQAAVPGVRFDFNSGCRVVVKGAKTQTRVRLSDAATGNVLFESEMVDGRINSAKRYFVRFRVEMWRRGERVFVHDYDCAGRDVLIQFPTGTIGDTMGWFPYAVRFQQIHKCRLTCLMAEKMIPLFRAAYPHIAFVTEANVQLDKFYATYSMGLFFDDKDNLWQPCDFRLVGLHRTAAYILGVDPQETPPDVALDDDTRPIPEPYVCIATHASSQCKHWNNPYGWHEITRFLQAAGYRVIAIDQKAVSGQGLMWTQIPNGAQDETGDRPLTERARWLRHAEFFVGLSSGLAWLAWATRTPVVLISGFTHPTNEFSTPYRVINYHTCNSCWNDPALRFDHKDFMWCPRHKDTPRQFECTRLITVEQVKAVIARIPGFKGAAPVAGA